jgi:hypothetical protein
VTRAEFLRQWENLGPARRPPAAQAEAGKRAFLDELIHKEALTLATESAHLPVTAADSTRLANLHTGLVRQVYFQRMVLDSLSAPAPIGGQAGSREAQVAAREAELIDRLVAPLAPRFDDSTAALLVRAFSKLPPEREEGTGWLRLQMTAWLPPVLPADTGRVLATTSQGDFTVGRFLRFWERLPLAQRDRPDTLEAIRSWAKSFLAQRLIDAEAERLGYHRLPQIESRLRAERQILAVESYYRHVVLARVDTSDARLESEWKKDPDRFRGPRGERYHGLWYRTEQEARIAAAALLQGATWDSVLAARYPLPEDPQLARITTAEAEQYRPLQLLTEDSRDSTLGAWYAEARPGQVFGPRLRVGQWWVYRFAEHDDGRWASFAEARPAVLQGVLAADGERELARHLVELRERFHVRVNESALAALRLPPENAGEGSPR